MGATMAKCGCASQMIRRTAELLKETDPRTRLRKGGITVTLNLYNNFFSLISSDKNKIFRKRFGTEVLDAAFVAYLFTRRIILEMDKF